MAQLPDNVVLVTTRAGWRQWLQQHYTRANRIAEIARLANDNIRVNQWRDKQRA